MLFGQVLPHGAVPRQAVGGGGVPADGAGHVPVRGRAHRRRRRHLQPLRRQQPLGHHLLGPLHGLLQAPLHRRLARVQRLQVHLVASSPRPRPLGEIKYYLLIFIFPQHANASKILHCERNAVS